MASHASVCGWLNPGVLRDGLSSESGAYVGSSVRITTKAVEPALRNEFWREVTRPVFETIPTGEDRTIPLEGSLAPRAVGGLLIGPDQLQRTA
jgi:hypothetical protein